VLFLNRDDQFCLLELLLDGRFLTADLCKLDCKRVDPSGSAASLPGRERLKLTVVALATPVGQTRGVQPFTTKEPA